MNLSRTPLTLAAASLALAGAGFLGSHGDLQALGNSTPIPHLDDDGDGLDNALEQRLGFRYDDADTDSDGYDDRAELISGTDAQTPDLPGNFPSASRSVTLEAYATSTHFVLQVLAHHTDEVDLVRFHFAREHSLPSRQYFTLESQQCFPYLDRMLLLPSSDPAYHVTSARFVIPMSAVATLGHAFAIGIEMVVDGGERVADQVRFSHFPPSGLTEVREVVIQGSGTTGGGNSGGGTGGLFPADPNIPPPPDEVIANQVCVQQLEVSGTLGAGGVVYSVAEAYCDSLLEASCSTQCSSSTGDTVIGIDIASLIN